MKRIRHGKYDDSENSRRQVTVVFSLPDGTGNIIQVCKNLFMEVFGVSRRRIETLVVRKKKGDIVYTETRGNKKKRSKFTVTDKDLIIEHVNSYPRDESHYGRIKKSERILKSGFKYKQTFS